jgi:beta-glucosidase
VVPVTNTGTRPGREVVLLFVRRPDTAIDRPAWVLGGFAKAFVAPGETAAVAVDIDAGALRHWDGAAWQIESGPIDVRVARSAADPGTVLRLPDGGAPTR